MTIEGRTKVLGVPVPGTLREYESVSSAVSLPGNKKYYQMAVASSDRVALHKRDHGGTDFKSKNDINKAKIRSGGLIVKRVYTWKPSL